MRQVFIKIFSMVMYFFGLISISLIEVSAHPGNTDSNGGHVCRTNCPSWGLEFGEYHTHSSSSAFSIFPLLFFGIVGIIIYRSYISSRDK